MIVSQRILDKIKTLPTPGIIGVSGFGGAGKSTFAKVLGEAINAAVVSVDSFQTQGAFDTDFSLWEIMDYSRLEKEVLIPMQKNSPLIRYGHFNAKVEKVDKYIEIENTGNIIIEGVGIFRPELEKYFTYKIWVDVSLEEATARGKKRDKEEYENPQDKAWDGVWKKNDLEYYETYSPKEKADLVIGNS